MTGIVVAAAVVAGLALACLVVFVGNRMVRSGEGGAAGGFADGLGMALDVFNPAQGRARQELEDQKHQGAIIPSTGRDDLPVTVDLVSGHARIRRAAG